MEEEEKLDLIVKKFQKLDKQYKSFRGYNLLQSIKTIKEVFTNDILTIKEVELKKQLCLLKTYHLTLTSNTTLNNLLQQLEFLLNSTLKKCINITHVRQYDYKVLKEKMELEVYVVTEHVKCSLQDVFQSKQALQELEIQAFICHMLDVCSFLDRFNLSHGGISPSQIFLTKSNVFKLGYWKNDPIKTNKPQKEIYQLGLIILQVLLNLDTIDSSKENLKELILQVESKYNKPPLKDLLTEILFPTSNYQDFLKYRHQYYEMFQMKKSTSEKTLLFEKLPSPRVKELSPRAKGSPRVNESPRAKGSPRVNESPRVKESPHVKKKEEEKPAESNANNSMCSEHSESSIMSYHNGLHMVVEKISVAQDRVGFRTKASEDIQVVAEFVDFALQSLEYNQDVIVQSQRQYHNLRKTLEKYQDASVGGITEIYNRAKLLSKENQQLKDKLMELERENSELKRDSRY